MPVVSKPTEFKGARQIVEMGTQALTERAASRDCDAERSMKACVKAFNAMFGTNLTVEQGWHFMVLLKMARSKNGEVRLDDYIDGSMYFALAGEEAQFERNNGNGSS